MALIPQVTEVLVSNATETLLDSSPPAFRRSIEIFNLGPNPIWCAVGKKEAAPATLVVNKCRRIGTYEAWQLDLEAGNRVWALADTADQVTGAATIVTEI